MTWLRNPDDLLRAAAGEPSVPLGTEAAAEGTVRWWSDQNGIGAIATDATAPWDIWFHFTDIEGRPQRPEPVVGEPAYVEYIRMNRESFRFQANRVVLLRPPPAPTEGTPLEAG